MVDDRHLMMVTAIDIWSLVFVALCHMAVLRGL